MFILGLKRLYTQNMKEIRGIKKIMEKVIDDIIDKIMEKANTGIKVMWAIVKGLNDKCKHLTSCDEKVQKLENYTEYTLSLIDTDTFNKVKIVIEVRENDKFLINITDIKGATVGVFDDIEEAVKQALYVLEHGEIELAAEQKKEKLDNKELIEALETLLKSLKEGK